MQNIFLQITGFNSINLAKVTRNRLRQHLAKRYKGPIATHITELFDLATPEPFFAFVDRIDFLLNQAPDKLFDMAFAIYDQGGDHQVDAVDMYALFKLYDRDYDELFVQAYSEDTCRIG